MLLRLRIDMPEPVMSLDLHKIGELFNVRYVTPGATMTSDGQKTGFIQMEIDGAAEMTEAAFDFLREHTYHLVFIQPMRKYTPEEERGLDALDYEYE